MLYRISTSEARAISHCETAWGFAFHPGWNLESNRDNDAITRGVMGHEILERFFKNLQQGIDYDIAEAFAMKHLNRLRVNAMIEDEDWKIPLLIELERWFPPYFRDSKEQILNWEILGVELELEMPLTDPASGVEITFVGKIDLVIKQRSGKYKGEISPVDHKFKYNFFTEVELEMNAQAPGYCALIKHNFPGSVVKRAFFNQIRTRNVKTAAWIELKERAVLKDEISGVLENHKRLAAKASYYRTIRLESFRLQMTRTISDYDCKGCQFKSLCKPEMMGKDIQPIISTDFRNRTYGYDNDDYGTDES